ncbi:hypothetical protein T265_08931 [Opisthorchis viverrini]|uniref:Uncharacterized protein n=1 Tax=Opisthorchis viverrini TaxID=6198 RepID=A0A074Z7Q0_OPIVI|nr:hypothetical protein T265_08931 [Opisthorchis viverrini]KER23123.1 hypothetical protein T265_08931 [Opisthorchis viverrini]
MAVSFEQMQALLQQQQAQFEKSQAQFQKYQAKLIETLSQIVSKQPTAIAAATDNVPSPEILTQRINQDPGNQGNGNQNDDQHDSNGSQDKTSKTAEALLADNDADEYEEYYSYKEGHVGAHQQTSSKLEKLDVDAKDLSSPAKTVTAFHSQKYELKCYS